MTSSFAYLCRLCTNQTPNFKLLKLLFWVFDCPRIAIIALYAKLSTLDAALDVQNWSNLQQRCHSFKDRPKACCHEFSALTKNPLHGIGHLQSGFGKRTVPSSKSISARLWMPFRRASLLPWGFDFRRQDKVRHWVPGDKELCLPFSQR